MCVCRQQKTIKLDELTVGSDQKRECFLVKFRYKQSADTDASNTEVLVFVSTQYSRQLLNLYCELPVLGLDWR